MTTRYFGPDQTRLLLGRLVRSLEETTAAVPLALETPDGRPVGQELRIVVKQLTRELAMEPEPLLRVCPSCGCTIFRAATRCGECWKSLTPYDARVAD